MLDRMTSALVAAGLVLYAAIGARLAVLFLAAELDAHDRTGYVVAVAAIVAAAWPVLLVAAVIDRLLGDDEWP